MYELIEGSPRSQPRSPRLTLKERKVFYLLLRDYNASEIGRKLGVGPNAIWKRMKKIRRRLKDALENYASA